MFNQNLDLILNLHDLIFQSIEMNFNEKESVRLMEIYYILLILNQKMLFNFE